MEEAPDAVESVALLTDGLGLLAPTFERIALNREQLTGGGFHDRAERDAEPDLMHGHIPNPLHLAAMLMPPVRSESPLASSGVGILRPSR